MSASARSLAWKLKRLWWQHCFTFHWAHKPLCERFHRDVLRLGSMRVCRSCFFAYAGMLCGLCVVGLRLGLPHFLPTSGFAGFRGWISDALVPTFLVTSAATVLGSLPWLYKWWPRWTRDILRAGIGWSVVLCATLLVEGHVAISVTGGSAMLVMWRIYFSQRAARKLSACSGCEELGQPGVCSGFQHQAECVRRYEDEASQLVTLSFNMPGPTMPGPTMPGPTTIGIPAIASNLSRRS
jgi:hypothetical protein